MASVIFTNIKNTPDLKYILASTKDCRLGIWDVYSILFVKNKKRMNSSLGKKRRGRY
jgi:hypothetical protein